MANIASTLPLIQTAVQQNPLSLDTGGSDSIFSSILDDTLFPSAKQITPSNVTVLGKHVINEDSEPLTQKTGSFFWDTIEGDGGEGELGRFLPGRNIDKAIFDGKTIPTETVPKNTDLPDQTPDKLDKQESLLTDIATENPVDQASVSNNYIQDIPAPEFIEAVIGKLEEKNPLQSHSRIFPEKPASKETVAQRVIPDRQEEVKTEQQTDHHKLTNPVRTTVTEWTTAPSSEKRGNSPNVVDAQNRTAGPIKAASADAVLPSSEKQYTSITTADTSDPSTHIEKNENFPSTARDTKPQTVIVEQVAKLIQENETAKVKITDITSNVKSYERLSSLTLSRENNISDKSNPVREPSLQNVSNNLSNNPQAAKVITEPGTGEISGRRSEMAIDARINNQPSTVQTTHISNSVTKAESQSIRNNQIASEVTGEEQITFKRESELPGSKTENGSRESLQRNSTWPKQSPAFQEIHRNDIQGKTVAATVQSPAVSRQEQSVLQGINLSGQTEPVSPQAQAGTPKVPALQAEVVQNTKQTTHTALTDGEAPDTSIQTKQPFSSSFSQKYSSPAPNTENRQQNSVEPHRNLVSSNKTKTENNIFNNRAIIEPSSPILQRPVAQNTRPVKSTGPIGNDPVQNAQSQVVNQTLINNKPEKSQTFSDKLLDKILGTTTRPVRNMVRESTVQTNSQNNNSNTQQQLSGQLEQQGSQLANNSSMAQNEQTVSFQSVSQTVQATTTQQTTTIAASSGTTTSSMVPEQLENSILNQVAEKLQLQTRNRETHLHLRLRPAELGELQIRLSMKSGAIKAHVFAQSGKVQEVLEKNMPRLKEMLEGQGMKIEEFVVSSQRKSIDSFDFFENQSSAQDREQENGKQNSFETEHTDNFESLLTEAVDPDSAINVKA